MSNVKILLLFSLLISGCGGTQHVFIVEPPFQPYYDRFLSDAKSQHVDLKIDNLIVSMVTGLPTSLEIGLCTYGAGISTVSILDAEWTVLTDAGKEQLIYHELGHCILMRPHLNGYLDSGIPISIMNFEHFDDFTYLQNHQYYVTELFHP